MEIHGYKVFDVKSLVDGHGQMVKAERPCDCCLGSTAKVLKASLEGMWEEVEVCKNCLIKGGMFLSESDLDDQVYELTGGRGRG